MMPIQRVCLRRIEMEDMSLLWKWSRSDELALFNAFSAKKSRAEFEKEYMARIGDTVLMDFLILHGDEEMPVGFCGVKDINWVDRHGEVFLSVCDEKARKLGVGTLALLITAKIAFFEMNLNKLYSKVASHNLRTLNMIKDWGFIHEGTMREMHYHYNRYHDIHIYGLLRSEAMSLFNTTIEKISKSLFPDCTPEILSQIKDSVNLVMGERGNPGGAYAALGSSRQ